MNLDRAASVQSSNAVVGASGGADPANVVARVPAAAASGRPRLSLRYAAPRVPA